MVDNRIKMRSHWGRKSLLAADTQTQTEAKMLPWHLARPPWTKIFGLEEAEERDKLSGDRKLAGVENTAHPTDSFRPRDVCLTSRKEIQN